MFTIYRVDTTSNRLHTVENITMPTCYNLEISTSQDDLCKRTKPSVLLRTFAIHVSVHGHVYIKDKYETEVRIKFLGPLITDNEARFLLHHLHME